MYLNNVKLALTTSLVLTSSWVFAQSKAPGPDDTTKPVSRAQFERLHQLIRPLTGEYAWRDEIPWESRFQAARARAVAEDKPILILASANADALGRT
jgi:hypothetical protein